ncbi:nitroreductase family deazaflavin-dependent oxidoreductase [Thermoactinospora rubra]|uniref:nitroreductase family deazaflavin-dependent oxidoreductase n=1 Tax=Thermoactinospora rubra TaxID=1088767 RepID=UPI00117FCDA9|nr:nitroreductase family deazaflavin-dependent oxidoreductase [Thermoactinospora rubra]
MKNSPKPAVTRTHPPKLAMALVNPIMRALLRRGKGGPSEHLMILHFAGRQSGKQYDVPVAQQRLDGRLCAFTNSGWRVNLRGGADVEVTLRGRRVPMRAELEEDPRTVAAAYDRMIRAVGVENARRLGISVNVDRAPTLEELAEAVEREGLSIVHLTPR